MPPLYSIEMGKNAHKFFKKVDVRPDGKPIYQLKSMEEFMEVIIFIIIYHIFIFIICILIYIYICILNYIYYLII